MKKYSHIPHDLVNQAILDRANGNRHLTSKAYLQRRIAEIQHDRRQEEQEFQKFVKERIYKVVDRPFHSIKIRPAFTVEKSFFGKLRILGAQG
jgi:hypothetical protein